nr:hypothetical protein BaRGS_006897 [Batillaria attramentaria]
MASCLSELFIWSLKNQYAIPGRDMTWCPRNKRPERLRDSIKEVELVLSNGAIISLVVCGHSGDVERIFIDKFMVGKFSQETVCHVSSSEPWPWSPMTSEVERANLIVLAVNGCIQPHKIYTVEQTARNPAEDKLLLGCSDGSMVFDMALTPLRAQFVTEDPEPEKFLKISRLFRTSVTLKSIDWCMFDPQSSENVTDYMDAMFLTFENRERFSAVELTKEYIKHRQIDELQATLATFYAPKPAVSEVTIVEYRDPISRLARRFFHHLLRYARFDKAFLLAVDIGARDLFMDLHYMAQDKGETALAEVARRKAEQADADSLGLGV